MSSNKFANDGSFMEMFKKRMESKVAENDSGVKEIVDQVTARNSISSSTSSSTSTPSQSESFSPSIATVSTSSISNSSGSSPSTIDNAKVSTIAGGNDVSNSIIRARKMNYLFGVGKRRGNAPVLKTGAVKKVKVSDEQGGKLKLTGDAFADYMAEVAMYKSKSCQDEDRTRPLVK